MNPISSWLVYLGEWHGPAASAARIVLILAGGVGKDGRAPAFQVAETQA